jgi:formylmethanofuran dehydrogenase subunit E
MNKKPHIFVYRKRGKPSLPEHLKKVELYEVGCSNCGKMLYASNVKDAVIEVKCKACGHYTYEYK